MAGLHSSQHLESETGPRREPPVRRFSLKRSCSRGRRRYAAVRYQHCLHIHGYAALLSTSYASHRAGRLYESRI